MIPLLSRCALYLALLPLIAAVPAQGPTMIRDLNTTPVAKPESAPAEGLAFGGWTYFSAERADTGRELFRTGGAPGTTELFADLVPGPSSSWPNNLTLFQGRLWFAADGGLWSTDGTPGGRNLVKSFATGPEELAVLGSVLFFEAGESPSNGELWKTDGTSQGTVQVADIHAGPLSSGPTGITAFGGHVYFGATDGIHGRELWRSDGSAPGTVMVRNIAPGSAPSAPQVFRVLGSGLYFFAQDAVGNGELWTTDGTVEGTSAVREIRPGSEGSLGVSDPLIVAGGELFFVADDGVSGRELWASDGSSAGTRMVRDTWPGSQSGALGSLTVAGSTVYFRGTDGTTGNELWRSDGTVSGTQLVVDLNPGAANGLPSPLSRDVQHALGNLLVVGATDGQTGVEPWITDGTTMTALADLNPNGGSFPTPLALDPTRTRLFFVANDGVLERELYATDGTPSGTELWDDIYPLGPETVGSNPGELTDVFGRVLFKATDGNPLPGPRGTAIGPSPWVTDGTEAGTTQIQPLWTTATTTAATLDGQWLFRAYTGLSGRAPWRSNGTAAGTGLVRNLSTTTFPTNPREFTVLGSSAMYVATDAYSGTGLLWQTDGAVTEPVTSPFGPPRLPTDLVDQDGILLFADRQAYSSSLWRSNGTAAGTWQLAPIYVQSIAAADRRAFVTGLFPTELWRTDGSTAGTQLIRSFGSAFIDELTASRGSVFFTTNAGVTGIELWYSDGTTNGTRLVIDLARGPGASQPLYLTAFRNGVLFSAFTPATGRELWFSDGTEQGTILVADLVPGTGSSTPTDLAVVGSRHAIFAARDGVNGREPWITDGTTPGTTMLGDLNPNGDSDPRDATLSGGRVVFTADDGVHGREPWVFDPGATAQEIGLGCSVPNGIRPILSAEDPLLGATIEVHARILAPGSFNALLLGASRPGLLWTGECYLFLHPGTIAVLSSAVTGATWTVTVPLPPVPALAGLPVGLQLVSALSSGQVELTNGVVWTLGLR